MTVSRIALPQTALPRQSLAFRAMRQLGAAVVCLALVLPIALLVGGSEALLPPVLAAATCLFGAMAGAMIVWPLRHMLDSFQRMSVAMLIRMAIPLAVSLAAIGVRSAVPSNVQAFVLYVVLFYLVALATEVWAAMQDAPNHPEAPRASSGPTRSSSPS